jgi:uncharacterized protein (DUF2236 family)
MAMGQRPPADVSRRMNAERLLLIAWLRALLLQLAHPLIAAGVAGHSTFRGGATAGFSRLHQTIEAMLAITFGEPEERERAIESIRSIHRRVHGTLASPCGTFPAGTPYSAEDSPLLIWVHATLTESTVLTYERLVEPLTSADRDRYCADSADVAVELGAAAGEVPRSWAEVGSYLRNGYLSGRVVVGPQALEIAAALLSPFNNRLANGIVAPLVSLLAAGQLPPHLRAEYGLHWTRRRARRYDRLMTVLGSVRRFTPRRIALWRRAWGGEHSLKAGLKIRPYI